MKRSPQHHLALLLVHRFLVVCGQNAKVVRHSVFCLRGDPTAQLFAQGPLQIGLANFVVRVEFRVANVHIVSRYAFDDRIVEIAIPMENHAAFRSWLHDNRKSGTKRP